MPIVPFGKKEPTAVSTTLPIKATIRLSRSSYIAGDTVSGRLTLTYSPEKSPSAKGGDSGPRSLRATAVQLQVSGTESTTAGDTERTPTVHLFRRYTVAGRADADREVAAAARQARREDEYLRSNARYAPLNGVVLSTGTGDDSETHERQARRAAETAKDALGESTSRDASFTGTPSSDRLSALPLGEDVELIEDQRYAVPFSFCLPPWLPPSYYCHFGSVVASLTYTVQVQLTGTGTCGADEAQADEVVLCEPFSLLSSLPLRELLQCHERANLKPAFTLRYRFRQFHANPIHRLVSPGPQSPVDVRVEFLSSSTVLLKDRKDRLAAMLHAESPGGVGSGPALGTTVMGDVVGGGSDGAGTSVAATGSRRGSQTVAPDPVGCLLLRVTVANGTDTRTVDNTKRGGRAVKSVVLQLQSRVSTTLGNREYHSDPFVLAKTTVEGNVPLGTSNTFTVRLPLTIDEFRRAKSSPKSATSPPTNFSSEHVTVSTSLVVSFPGLETIAEDQPPANVVVLADTVDPSNRVPYLPNDWRKYAQFTDNHAVAGRA